MRRRAFCAQLAALAAAACSTPPLDKGADKVIEAETRDERTLRIFGFSAVVVDYAVSSATIAEIPRVRLFVDQVTASLDAFDANPLWVESQIMELVQIFAAGAKGRITDLIGVGSIPSTNELLDYIGGASMASAMLRDVAWIMGEVKAGRVTAGQAKGAFRRRINDEAAKLATVPVPEPELPPTVVIE